MKEQCANWMNYEAIRETAASYDKTWGLHDEVSLHDLSDFNIKLNCMGCNMRPDMLPGMASLFQIADMFKDPTLVALERVGMKRKCYKRVVE